MLDALSLTVDDFPDTPDPDTVPDTEFDIGCASLFFFLKLCVPHFERKMMSLRNFDPATTVFGADQLSQFDNGIGADETNKVVIVGWVPWYEQGIPPTKAPHQHKHRFHTDNLCEVSHGCGQIGDFDIVLVGTHDPEG